MPTYKTSIYAMLRPVFAALLALLALVSLPACGGGREGDGGEVEYSISARENYEKGMDALENEEWLEGAKYFAFVKARFPYSKFAVLADLRICDAQFGAGIYLEAIDGYRQFIKFHPTHEMVTNGYASFRIGEAYYKMLPDDWFLTPPSYEKDQSATIDAVRELGTFLKTYPSSPFVERAQKMYKAAARELAAHEWYVAQFYWKRDRPMGTVLRLRTLLKKYPDVGYDEEALWLLGRAYLRVGRPKDAKATFQTLVSKYPKGKHTGDAQGQLRKLL
jgi:outer membrane protein assembly factor BamD